MPLDSILSSASPTLQARGRSLIAKFTTPLANRNKNISDFHIDADDPWRQYGPGDLVKGSVVLTVVKPIRITHLVVCLNGQARVFKNQVAPGEGYAEAGFLGANRGRRGQEYHGNGFMTLFEDEIVLCGEGRLKEGVYKFRFELEFPKKSLPSSIDFERGVVCYNIAAILTRPITIAPTVSCDRRIQFQDAIDIAKLPCPKPKSISLEPIVKRGRVKNRVITSTLDMSQKLSSPSLSRTDTDTSTSVRSVQQVLSPGSPAPSDTSRASIATESSQSFRIVQHSAPSITGNSTKSSDPRSSSSSMSDSLITATTEVQRAGALPGDNIPIRISIKHTKHVRGVAVVTLYRQGRIDLHPALPMGRQSKGKTPEYEDVYPRSRTGLGGLHFSSGSPSSVFRKDLAQTTAPMIINPQTMTAEIKTSIRLPEDAFPTINNVPGSMITFTYHLEVVIDVCGKLNESRLIPRMSMTTPSNTYEAGGSYDRGNNLTTHWADRIIDTTPIRRIKTVVYCLFDVTVGNRDSARVIRERPEEEQNAEQGLDHGDDYNGEMYDAEWSEEDYRNYYDEGYYQYNGHEYWNGWTGTEAHDPPTFLPPPEPEVEPDEKTRLRRAEELLLPSQPPQEDELPTSSTSNGAAHEAHSGPTAPYLPDEDGLYGYRGRLDGSSQTQDFRPLASAVSARSVDTVVPGRTAPSDRLAAEDGPLPNEEGHDRDDKQELERRRLLAQASAPPADDEEGQTADTSGTMGPQGVTNAPSAPVLTEEDEYRHQSNGDHHYGGQNGVEEHLPQYQR